MSHKCGVVCDEEKVCTLLRSDGSAGTSGGRGGTVGTSASGRGGGVGLTGGTENGGRVEVVDALGKYTHSLALSYVEDNARVQFCPSVPWCGHAIQVR